MGLVIVPVPLFTAAVPVVSSIAVSTHLIVPEPFAVVSAVAFGLCAAIYAFVYVVYCNAFR